MVFFKQTRNYIICFILFGMWSSWQDFHYKRLLQAYSILCIFTELCSYILTMFFTDLWSEGITFVSIIANSSVYIMMCVQLVIGLESFFKSKSQVQLIRKFSEVDQLFSSKLDVSVQNHKERRELFMRNFLLIAMILSIKITLWIYTRFINPVLCFFYCTMYSSWIVRFRLIQVLLFVCLVRNRLILINDQLVQIKHTAILPTDKKDKFKNVVVIVDAANNSISNYERMIHLKQIYGKLYEINEFINKIFGASLLGSTII